MNASPPAETTPSPAPNPYVGPRAFTEADQFRFFGREREAFDLLDVLIAERIVLLYSPSGAGKTSLLKAGLIPKLRDEGFRVLPVIRVNQDPPPDLTPRGDLNRYRLSTLLSLEQEDEKGENGKGDALPADQRLCVGSAELAGLRLGQYLDRLPRPEGLPEYDVLIFDQFEEILTIEPNSRAGWTARHAFFRDVGDALCDRRRWAVFSLREDYVAGLDPYLRPIPTRLSNRFRLDLLRTEEAPLAITRPPTTIRHTPSDPPVVFAQDAVERLVSDLGRPPGVRPDEAVVDDPGGTASAVELSAEGMPGKEQPAAEDLNLYVEPLHLQVVCDRLWRRLQPLPGAVLTAEKVGPTGSVDEALAEFYNEEVAKVAGSPDVERQIREWFGEQLIITEQGIRGQVPEGPTESGGLDNEIIKALVEARLVRREGRLNAAWYELSHDRMIGPVRASNAAWFRTSLNDLQRAAMAWNASDRPNQALLGLLDLARAYWWTWRSGTRPGVVERTYLAASRARWIPALLLVSAITLVMLLGWIVYSRIESADENRADEINGAKQLAIRAADLLNPTTDEGRVDVALLLALEAAGTLDDQGVDIDESIEAEQSLFSGLVAIPHLRGILPGHEQSVTDVAFSPDGRWLVSAGADGRILQWELRAGGPSALPITVATPVPLNGAPIAATDCRAEGPRIPNLDVLRQDVRVIAVGASPSSGTPVLAIGAVDGSIVLQDLAFGGELARLCRPQEIVSLAFSRDGRMLAIGDAGGLVVWDTTGGPSAQTVLPIPPATGQFAGVITVQDLAFSPDGSMLAAAHGDGRVLMWDLPSTGEPIGDPWTVQLDRPVSAVAFSADSRTLAAGDVDGTVRLWDPNRSRRDDPPVVLPTQPGAVTGLAFNPNPDGRPNMLASSHADGGVVLWPEARWSSPQTYGGTPTPIADQVHQNATGLAFSPAGTLLVSGGADGSLALWDPLGLSPLGQSVSGLAPSHASRVVSVTFGGDEIVSVDEEGEVSRWPTTDPGIVPELGNGPASSPEATPIFDLLSGLVQLQPGMSTPTAEIARRAIGTGGGVLVNVRVDGGVELVDPGMPGADPTVLPSPEECGEAAGAAPNPRSLAVGPDGRLAVGDAAGDIRVWRLDPSDPCPRRMTGPTAAIVAMAFADEGRRLVAGDQGGSIWVWRLDSQDDRGTLLGELGLEVTALTADPSGQAVAVGLEDGTIWRWDEADPDRRATQVTSTSSAVVDDVPVDAPADSTLVKPISLAFGHDGKLLAAGFDDGAIVVWNLAVGDEPIGELPGHGDAVTALAWGSGTGTPVLASGSADGTVFRWTFDVSLWEKYACVKAGREDLDTEEQEHYLGLKPQDQDKKGPCTGQL